MGKQSGSLTSGKVGPLTYYVINGEQYVKSAGPEHIKQTDATKAKAVQFGNASRTAKLIRTAFPALKALSDLKMRNSLTSALHNWMIYPRGSTNGGYTAIPDLYNYEFNREVHLLKRLKAPLTTDWNTPGKVIINIPGLSGASIETPEDVKFTELWMGLISCRPGEDTPGNIENISLRIPYKAAVGAQQVELPLLQETDMITIVAAGIRYILSESSSGSIMYEGDRNWMAGKVLAAVFRKD